MVQQLSPSSGNASDVLGLAMDLSSDGTQLIASATGGDDAAAVNAGMLYIFSKAASGQYELTKTVTQSECKSSVANVCYLSYVQPL